MSFSERKIPPYPLESFEEGQANREESQAGLESLTLLGSTGSIGRQALEVCQGLGVRPLYLACRKNMRLLAEQIESFRPLAVSVSDDKAAAELRQRLRPSFIETEILTGQDGLMELARRPSGRCLSAISGFAGFAPTVAAAESGHDLALANKESLVAGGSLLMPLLRRKGLSLYPVDSEHSAIWQCLAASPRRALHKIWLTASGGPFLHYSREQLAQVKPEMALKHPNWQMGAKVTVDSASLMNKGLELIEAMWLFALPEDKIGIVVHPESLIHSLVEWEDGALLGQLGLPDMRLPISLSLSWPERRNLHFPRFDFLAQRQELHFEAPDLERFPALKLAREAAAEGGAAPLILNAANEVAVRAFLDSRLEFTAIAEKVERALQHFSGAFSLTDATMDDIIECDRLVREWSETDLA